SMNDITGRIALVTGASRGIGRAIAVALASGGADVVVNFLKNAEEAQAVQAQILQLGRRCITVQADVSLASEVVQLANEVQSQLGAVDILVNNAGIARPQALEEIAESDW